MAWFEARNSIIIKTAEEFLVDNEPTVAEGDNIEVEAKFVLSRGSEGSRHLAYQTAMLFSNSAKRIETITEPISSGRDNRYNIDFYINKKKSSIKVTKYNSSNLRSRRISTLNESHQLNPNVTTKSWIENDVKKRVNDLSIPMVKGSNRIIISTSIESKSDRNIFVPNTRGMRTTVRYDVTNGLREFLNLRSESTITIDIEYTGNRDIKLEIEAGQDDEYKIFMQDVLTIEDYIVNYPTLNRPEDISKNDLTHSTFFNNGPYLVTMKNNGNRILVFFDLTVAVIIDSAGRLLNVIQGDYTQLTGYCIDLERSKNENNITEYVVLDSSNLRSSRKMTHTQRMNRLHSIIGDNYNIDGILVVFKEFRIINNLDDYYTYIPKFVERIGNGVTYDGIVLVPDYRPFVLPYPVHNPSKIFRYKPTHTIDINERILRNIIEDNRSHRRYQLIVDVNPRDISEYAIKNVTRHYDNVGEVFLVDLTLTRDRPDRSTPNNITNIIKMIEVFREGITLDDLVPASLRQLIKLSRSNFGDPTSIEVIGDNSDMREIITRDLLPSTTVEDDNPIRIILFPDDHYDWDNIDHSIPTYIIGHSYIRLLRAIGQWGNISVSINSPTITVIDNKRQYEYSQDIGNRVIVDNWMSLIPDSLYHASKYSNSLIVIKLGFDREVMSEPISTVNNVYEDRYDMPLNRLTKLFMDTAATVGRNNRLELYLLLSSLGVKIKSEPSKVDDVDIINASNGPTWWLPSISYPIMSNLTAITLMHYLSGRPYDNSPDTVLNMMTEYLHPLGMVNFVNLSEAEMEGFLERISNEYTPYMAARFLSSFILLFKVMLECEIHTSYRDVHISSGVAIRVGNKSVRFNAEHVDVDTDKNNRFLITNMHQTHTVAQLPGVWIEPYSIKNDGAYQRNVGTMIGYINRSYSANITVFDLKNNSFLFNGSRNNPVTVSKYCDLCTQLIYLTVGIGGNRELAKQLNTYNNGVIPRSFVFRDILCPNNRLIDETCYMSINWSAAASGDYRYSAPTTIYSMIDENINRIALP